VLKDQIEALVGVGKSFAFIAKTLGISKSTVKYYLWPDQKKKAADRKRHRKHRIKRQAVDYKGGKCIFCTYNRCLAALEFHHIDPEKKDFEITEGARSFEAIKAELDKTVLVCANCHRELEAGLLELPASYLGFSMAERMPCAKRMASFGLR